MHHHHQHPNIAEEAALAELGGMLPPAYDTTALYEPPAPRIMYRIPRVVPHQKTKFDSDELFRRLSRETEVRYTGYRERTMEERRVRFLTDCRKGYTEISFVATGTNLHLYFNANRNPYVEEQECDFEREHGKVHLRSSFIMNGVCVRFRGWLDLERLDGVGCLEYDEGCAHHEDAQLNEQFERYIQRMNDANRIYAPIPPLEAFQRVGAAANGPRSRLLR